MILISDMSAILIVISTHGVMTVKHAILLVTHALVPQIIIVIPALYGIIYFWWQGHIASINAEMAEDGHFVNYLFNILKVCNFFKHNFTECDDGNKVSGDGCS